MEVRQIITQIHVQLPIGGESKKEEAWCIMWEQNTWSQVGGAAVIWIEGIKESFLKEVNFC